MSRRVLKLAVFSPAPFLHSLKPFYRFFTANDNLEGLITDNEIGDSINAPQHSPALYLSPQDLSFLKESISDAKAENFESGKCLTDALSIINAIKNYNDGLGEESQKYLRKFRAKLDENLVVNVLRNVQNSELGIKFFMWAGRQMGYSHTLAVYDALLELLGGGRGERVGDHFLREIKKDDGEVLGR